MTTPPLITALELPKEARVDQRVPKKLLVEQGAPTAADKRQIQDGIEEVIWVAALKPTNIGVPVYRDDVREYLEIAILTVEFRPTAKPSRLIELIHRAVPYPVVLAAQHRDTIDLSLSHKRRSEGETGRVVIEGIRDIQLNLEAADENETAFLTSLAVSRLPNHDLFALYDGILARVAALEAARIGGFFSPPASSEQAASLRAGLDDHVRLRRELTILRAKAGREKQLNRRVELNLEIKRLEGQLSAVSQSLTGVSS